MTPALWRPEHSPAAIPVAAAPESFGTARSIDPALLSSAVSRAETAEGLHVLLDDPTGRHRLWLIERLPVGGHAFLIPLDADFGARLHSLQRFHRSLSGKHAGPKLRSLQLTAPQRARLTLQVRALDGKQEGASRREIAAILLDPQAHAIPAIEWKNASLRKKVNRVVANALSMMNGGYLTLLRGDPARASRFRRR